MEIEMLLHIPLFQGLQKEEISSLLSCLGAYQKAFQKDEILLRAGTPALSLGVVLQGSVHIVTHSYWGASHIWGHVQAGEIFGEAYALLPEKDKEEGKKHVEANSGIAACTDVYAQRYGGLGCPGRCDALCP